jgi:hypothetical protein
VLALPVLDQTERLQRGDDVLRLDSRHLTHILDGDVSCATKRRERLHTRPHFAPLGAMASKPTSVLPQNLEQNLGPVAPEAQQPLLRAVSMGYNNHR